LLLEIDLDRCLVTGIVNHELNTFHYLAPLDLPVRLTFASKAESRDLKSWLGSLRATGRITGDIASPAVPENEWEAGRR